MEDYVDKSPFHVTVGRMISDFSRSNSHEGGSLSKGDISSLRRMDPKEPCSVFWRMLASNKVEGCPENDRKWALVVKCMAITYPNMDSQVNPGQSFRDAGFSQASDIKMSRLLKAEEGPFEDYLVSAIRQVSAKKVSINWMKFAEFVFFQNIKSKRNLAKDFYSNQ